MKPILNKLLFILLLTTHAILITAQDTISNPQITRLFVDPSNNGKVYIEFEENVLDNGIVDFYSISFRRENDGFRLNEPKIPWDGRAGKYFAETPGEAATLGIIGYSIISYKYVGTGDDEVKESTIDSTIFLYALEEVDLCSRSVHLYWNDYNAWRGEIAEYQILNLSTDGLSSTLVKTVSANTLDTEINLEPTINYRLYVAAVHESRLTDAIVTSNGYVPEGSLTVYPEFIHADYGTVNSNHPLVQFSLDPNSELTSYLLSRSNTPEGPYDSLTYLYPESEILTYSDTEVDASTQAYYYQLSALNDCSYPVLHSENKASTIFLSAVQNNKEVSLNWNEYHNWLEDESEYKIIREINGRGEEIASTQNIYYTDNDLLGVGGKVCYRIIANEIIGGNTSEFTSISNTECVEVPFNITFVEAFIPGRECYKYFMPEFETEPNYYNLKIFNRSGTVFYDSSDDADKLGWDGSYKNSRKLAPQAVYRYALVFEDAFGNRQTIRGSVTLVREN